MYKHLVTVADVTDFIFDTICTCKKWEKVSERSGPGMSHAYDYEELFYIRFQEDLNRVCKDMDKANKLEEGD